MEAFDLRKWKGFAASGGSTANLAIVDQVAIDSRRIHSRNTLFVSLKGSNFDGHNFIDLAAAAGASYALVRKDWEAKCSFPNLTLLRVDDPLQSFQEIAKTYRESFACKVVGITGSYGKTMVKDLLFTLLSKTKNVVASPGSFNSQVGVPISLFQINKETDIALIEAAASRQGEMDILADIIKPDFSIITHTGSKHIATFGSIENIFHEMTKLAQKTDRRGWVFAPHHALILPYLDQIRARIYFWDIAYDNLPHACKSTTFNTQDITQTVVFPNGKIVEEFSFAGQDYYADLINLSIKPASLLGVSDEDIQETLQTYKPEPMRTEIWQSPFGTTFINEPYGSDPLSIDQSLNYFKTYPSAGKKIFLFGGLRGQHQHQTHDYARIGEMAAKLPLDRLLLIGDNSLYKSLTTEARKHRLNMDITHHHTQEEAIMHLKERVKPEDFVLIRGKTRFTLDRLTEAFHGSICPNQCFINLAAIESNLAAIRRKLPAGTRMMIMVKAFAYGMNDVRMAQFLARKGIDILGVSYVDEGIALRRAGISQSIFSLHASPYEATKVVEWGLEVGVGDKTLIDALAEASSKQKRTINIHLHVDTGMSRLGCRPEEAVTIAKLILSKPYLKLEGIMTHFASADNPQDDPFTYEQIHRFNSVVETLHKENIIVPWKHAANSSAMMRFSLNECNMARIGLALYGINPSTQARENLDLRPAISLFSRIVGIHQCKKGDTVSYGRNYIVDRDDKRIAVIPIGYYDGFHRSYSGKGTVIIHGKRAQIVGNICMDFMMVDVSDIQNSAINDTVLLFGEDSSGNTLAPEEFAEKGNTIPHELISCLGPRIQRVFIHEETQKSC